MTLKLITSSIVLILASAGHAALVVTCTGPHQSRMVFTEASPTSSASLSMKSQYTTRYYEGNEIVESPADKGTMKVKAGHSPFTEVMFELPAPLNAGDTFAMTVSFEPLWLANIDYAMQCQADALVERNS